MFHPILLEQSQHLQILKTVGAFCCMWWVFSHQIAVMGTRIEERSLDAQFFAGVLRLNEAVIDLEIVLVLRGVGRSSSVERRFSNNSFLAWSKSLWNDGFASSKVQPKSSRVRA